MEKSSDGLRRTGVYVSASIYKASASGGIRYCFGHKVHRPSLGGKHLGPHRMYYCAECVQARKAKQGEPK